MAFGNGGQDQQDPYRAELGPAQIVQNFVEGNIEPGSTLKIMGCLGAVSLAPQIATLLQQSGKADVSVIASPHIVHATGKGIVSYPIHKTDDALNGAYAARNNSSKKLKKQMAAARVRLGELTEEVRTLREAAAQAIAAGGAKDEIRAQLAVDIAAVRKRGYKIFNSFARAGGRHFDATVLAFSTGYGVDPSHWTPAGQGWVKFIGDANPLPLTQEDELPKRPAPQVAPIEELGPQQLEPLVAEQVAPQPGGGAYAPPLAIVDATHDHPLM